MDAAELRLALPSWRAGTTLQALTTFLYDVTQGPDALAVSDRIAAFDNDGTLACERPHTAAAAFLSDRLTASGRAAADVGGGHEVLRELAALFAGQTTGEYEQQGRRFLARARHPRFQRPYGLVTYLPMLELIALLHVLEFSVFMCTDSSRDFMRVLAGPSYGLARERIIGSEVGIEFVEGSLLRTSTPVPLADGPGKPAHLWDRTGAQPVLAAGNSAGDIAMLRAARFALVVDHDDDVREYAYQDEQILDAALLGGWTVLSMRQDFVRLFSNGPAEPTAAH